MSALIQGTKEWLQARREKVGSSDAPVIMGVSPWSTPLQCWEEKMGLREARKKTAAMQYGLDTEEEARQAFEKMTDIYVFQDVIDHPEKKWMRASLDGIDVEKKHIVEIKCPRNSLDHEIAKTYSVPEKYYPQVQHQIFVCELDKAYYFSYFNKEGVIVEVKRDEKYLKKLLEEEEKFWDCMQNFIAPDAIEKDYVKMGCATWTAYEERYAAIDASLNKLEKEKEELRQHLLEMAGGQNVVGNRLKLSKVVRKGIVDYKTVPELEGVNLEKYRKAPTTTWRITNAEISNTRPKV